MNRLQKVRFRVFDYVEELDCFVINKEFKAIVDALHISEWNEVTWIGRYFSMDNDFGEHWFDNWEEREMIADKAKQSGIRDEEQLLIITPERFVNNADGPCHSKQERKQFWHDVLYSLEISLQTLFNECRKIANAASSQINIEQAERIIIKLSEKYCKT